MDLLLNIGMERHGTSNIALGTVLRELNTHGFTVIDHLVRQSDTEPTVVARVRVHLSRDPALARLHWVSILLGQQCLAVYDLSLGRGDLVGPRADKWGPFNANLFLLFDGSRLSEHLPAFAA